jgi:hypothetical protein
MVVDVITATQKVEVGGSRFYASPGKEIAIPHLKNKPGNWFGDSMS